MRQKVSFTDLKAIVLAKPNASIQAFLIEDHWFLAFSDGNFDLSTVLSTVDPGDAADVTDFVTNFLPSANVQIDNKIYELMTIIIWKRTNKYKFYTSVNGYKSYVLVKRSTLINWFLTTSPDGIEENNLNSLPSC